MDLDMETVLVTARGLIGAMPAENVEYSRGIIELITELMMNQPMDTSELHRVVEYAINGVE